MQVFESFLTDPHKGLHFLPPRRAKSRRSTKILRHVTRVTAGPAGVFAVFVERLDFARRGAEAASRVAECTPALHADTTAPSGPCTRFSSNVSISLDAAVKNVVVFSEAASRTTSLLNMLRDRTRDPETATTFTTYGSTSWIIV
jgi:hypothetical protein